MPTHLVLASASPRRADLLMDAGYAPVITPVDIDETPHPGESPVDYVKRMAREKTAASVADHPEWEDRPLALFLGADTVVIRDETILGKPRDAVENRAMIASLSGRAHEVRTAFAVGALGVGSTRHGIVHEACVVTRVRFRQLSAEEIDAYVATGEGLDKAGGYGIQGGAGAFVEEVDGSYDNVVGLPVTEVAAALEAQGYQP